MRVGSNLPSFCDFDSDFDLSMTFDPQEMASKMTSDYFDSIFYVPWSLCNQKLPD